jgi:hypothetical protein
MRRNPKFRLGVIFIVRDCECVVVPSWHAIKKIKIQKNVILENPRIDTCLAKIGNEL